MPSKVINPFGETEFDQTNAAELQASLERLTADVTRWKQWNYCTLIGDSDGIDRLTEEHLEAGVYHDFELSADLVEKLRERGDIAYRHNMLPVANCGTAFCVAGDINVHNGWTFVGSPGEDYTMRVIPTPDVPKLLEIGYVDSVRAADAVAREVLNVNERDADVLFAPENSLVRIWTLGYALTGGRLTLPDALPATEPGDSPGSPELKTAQTVRDAVMIDLAGYTRYHDNVDRFFPLLDFERLRTLTSTDAGRALIARFGWMPTVIAAAIDEAEAFIADSAADDETDD